MLARLQGPNQAVLCPDTRSERTLHQVMSAEHYNLIFERCSLRDALHQPVYTRTFSTLDNKQSRSILMTSHAASVSS